jgi:hypothetical protein
MSKKGKKRKGAQKAYTELAGHQREKKSLVPPFMKVGNLRPMSWTNDRLPEMLWCALLLSQMGRGPALAIFRKVAKLIPQPNDGKTVIDPTHSGLGSLDPVSREKVLSVICSEEQARESLRPLLLLGKLPARECWLKAIGQLASAEDWEALKAAVARVLYHQTQEATDCRWVRVLFRVLSGKFVLRSREEAREILEYPTYGEQEKVRPTIRAMEGVLDAASPLASTWPKDFWEQCLRDTDCKAVHTMEANIPTHVATTRARVRQVRDALAEHEKKSLVTTDVDAMHDAVFGFAAYALSILDELISLGNSTAILGRIGLRTLLECFITLSYLRRENNPELWAGYR